LDTFSAKRLYFIVKKSVFTAYLSYLMLILINFKNWVWNEVIFQFFILRISIFILDSFKRLIIKILLNSFMIGISVTTWRFLIDALWALMISLIKLLALVIQQNMTLLSIILIFFLYVFTLYIAVKRSMSVWSKCFLL
jgi:hypothetical protein